MRSSLQRVVLVLSVLVLAACSDRETDTDHIDAPENVVGASTDADVEEPESRDTAPADVAEHPDVEEEDAPRPRDSQDDWANLTDIELTEYPPQPDVYHWDASTDLSFSAVCTFTTPPPLEGHSTVAPGTDANGFTFCSAAAGIRVPAEAVENAGSVVFAWPRASERVVGEYVSPRLQLFHHTVDDTMVVNPEYLLVDPFQTFTYELAATDPDDPRNDDARVYGFPPSHVLFVREPFEIPA